MLGVMSDRQVFGLVDPFALWVSTGCSITTGWGVAGHAPAEW